MIFEKTVLQVIPALDAGGAERTTVEMARAIVKSGGKALVATSGGRFASDIEKAGGGVILLPVASKNPAAIIANAGALTRIIEREGVDLIHARSRAPAWSALFAARKARIPLVTTYHGAYKGGFPAKRFYNSSMVRGDLVIANSEFTAASVRTAYPFVKRLAVIPRGADVEEFNPSAISSARISALREKWGLVENPERLILLLPARLTAWKGHEIALSAASKLTTAAGVFPSFQLVFVGGAQGRGDFAALLSRRIIELGLQQVVQSVGHCDDMPAAYALADFVLSPSIRPEAFGRVAVEAAAVGKIAIAADHGGACETVSNGGTGFLFAPGSADALEMTIRKAAAMSAAERQEMGARARRRAVDLFSITAMTDATIKEYQSLLTRKNELQ